MKDGMCLLQIQEEEERDSSPLGGYTNGRTEVDWA